MKQAFDIFGSWWYEQLGGIFVVMCWAIVAFLAEFAYMILSKHRTLVPYDFTELAVIVCVLGFLAWLVPPVVIIALGVHIIVFIYRFKA